MKLRFEVNQAEAFRKGIDAPHSITSVDVNPGELTPDVRELIANRLYGIEVCRLVPAIPATEENPGTIYVAARRGEPVRVMTTGVTFADLLEAVIANEKELNGQTGTKLFIDERLAVQTHGSMP